MQQSELNQSWDLCKLVHVFPSKKGKTLKLTIDAFYLAYLFLFCMYFIIIINNILSMLP